MKIQVTLQVDQDLYRSLAEEAKREDRTIAAQVRRILKERYQNQDDERDRSDSDTSDSGLVPLN